MKTKLSILAMSLMAGGALLAQPRVSVGIGVGVGGYGSGYAAPPAYEQRYVPPCPGPGYEWVDGYWAPQGGRNVWITGFWRAPHASYRVAPRYYAPRYSNSFRGNDHDHDRDDHGRNTSRGGERRDHDGRSNSFRR